MKNWTSNQWPKNKQGGYVVIPLVIAAAGAAVQARAANQQANVATSVANYNAKVDVANAQQLQMDAAANVERQRVQDKAYLSKMRTAYAASGIRSGSGTPMEVLATTAGRQESDIQNYWTSVNQKSDRYYGAAAEGIAEGKSNAELYHLKAASAVISGLGKVAGVFAGGGSMSSGLGSDVGGGLASAGGGLG